jgi:NADH-quinone oxidoreductase subunit M
MVQMISHGFISGAMFSASGCSTTACTAADRRLRRRGEHHALVRRFFVLFAMANAGLPGTSGFVGEFMVILAAFQADFWLAFLAATTLILGAAYTLWLVKRVIFGEVGNDNVAEAEGHQPREPSCWWFWPFSCCCSGSGRPRCST